MAATGDDAVTASHLQGSDDGHVHTRFGGRPRRWLEMSELLFVKQEMWALGWVEIWMA